MSIEPSADRKAFAQRPPRQRSKVTNGKRMFVDGDGTSAWARRYQDIIAGHASDMGGADTLSEAQRSLIRRASAIELELEQMEGKLSTGERVDLDVFTRAASHLRRLLETLGVERRPRDVTPTLPEYLAKKASQAAAGESNGTKPLGSPEDGNRASGRLFEFPPGNQNNQVNQDEAAE